MLEIDESMKIKVLLLDRWSFEMHSIFKIEGLESGCFGSLKVLEFTKHKQIHRVRFENRKVLILVVFPYV